MGAIAAFATSCSGDAEPGIVQGPVVAAVPALTSVLDAAAPLLRYSSGVDRFEVWVCRVPTDTKEPRFDSSGLRLDLEPGAVADQLDDHVEGYFEELSHGRYRPAFVAGGEVVLAQTDPADRCVELALGRSGADADGVAVVADAEFAAGTGGGWGRAGDACAGRVACPASDSARATFIGASDFHPDWGEVPAVDLQEHEIGHTLGWPHSGVPGEYSSRIDVMSDSAAARAVDPDARHAPGTLALNLLSVGWIPLDDVVLARGGTYQLVPSSNREGPRLLVLGVDDDRFLAVEVIAAEPLNEHLPHDGVAVHLIDTTPAICGTPVGTDERCHNEDRFQWSLAPAPGSSDLLVDGDTWSGEGWRVEVLEHDERWVLDVRPQG